MARYVARVATDRSPADVFAYLSDFRTVAEWDPGVLSSEQIDGDGAGPGATYDVVTSNDGRELRFRYRTTEFREPSSFTVVGKRFPLTSTDRVTVATDDGRTIVTYDAVLEVPLLTGLADRVIGPTFEEIGDAAAQGLADALGGEWLR